MGTKAIKYSWATDLHLNFLLSKPAGSVSSLGQYLKEDSKDTDYLIISGDTSEAPHIKSQLIELQVSIGKTIYFVLGNHDFYSSCWSALEESLKDLPKNIIFLDNIDYIKHSKDICIIGQSGWFDGILDQKKGFVAGETQRMSDCKFDPPNLLLQKAEDRAKQHGLIFEEKARKAYSDGFRRMVFVTHAPPFSNASWHEGHQSEPGWLGLMSSGYMGQSIQYIADLYKDLQIVVLCGHTHSYGEYNRGTNIKVLTGNAKYYFPDFVNGFSSFNLEDLFVFDRPITNWGVFSHSGTDRL